MDTPSRITLGCSSHNETLVKGLWQQFNFGHDLDFDFQYGVHNIRAHKLVAKIFLLPRNEVHKREDEIVDSRSDKIDKIDNNNILSLIEFMYTGTCTVAVNEVSNLLTIAQEIGFQMLVDTVSAAQCNHKLAERSPEGSVGSTTVVTGRTGLRQRKMKPIELTRSSPRRLRMSPTPSARNSGHKTLNCGNAADADDLTKDLPSDQLTAEERDLSSEQTDASAGQQERKTECEMPTVTTGSAVEEVAESNSSEVTRQSLWRRRRPLLKCEQCDYQNRCRVLFTVHMAKHDSTITVFRCNRCSQAFLDQASLDRHSDKHAGKPDIHQCPHCPYKNRQNSWYQLHLHNKHGASNVPVERCTTCGRPFLSPEAMARHKCVREEAAILSCPHCEFKTSRMTFYRRHLAKHDSSVAVHRCDMCSQAFLSLPALTAHRSAHTAYSCPHCPFDTRKSNVYYHHLYAKHRINTKGETVPEKVKKYRCQDCEYRCVQLSELKIHRTAKHSPELPFHCQHCSFSSGRKGNVVRHIKWVHLGQRSEQFWMCELCGHKTRTQAKLVDHKRRHTDDKPHTCTICSKQYKDRTSFKRHVLRHDGDTKEFLCHLCSFCCNRLDNLKGHLKRIHSHVS